jgi:hypothetical protein
LCVTNIRFNINKQRFVGFLTDGDKAVACATQNEWVRIRYRLIRLEKTSSREKNIVEIENPNTEKRENGVLAEAVLYSILIYYSR